LVKIWLRFCYENKPKKRLITKQTQKLWTLMQHPETLRSRISRIVFKKIFLFDFILGQKYIAHIN